MVDLLEMVNAEKLALAKSASVAIGLEGTRHITLISVADSLLLNRLHKNKETEEQLKDFFIEINNSLCIPKPLPESELNSIWRSALEFVQRIKKNDLEKRQFLRKDPLKQEQERMNIVEEASEIIKKKHKFIAVEELKDILYYRNGIYMPGGEEIIEKEAELLFGYSLSNKLVAEIKGHIVRSTYRNRIEFDTDINVINLKNGLYYIDTGKLVQHTPDYLSINQIEIRYNPDSKCKRFGTYLSQVLYPAEIRTALELMAYTFHKDNPFEIIAVLFGYGSNGKSVFTGVLTKLHGAKNVSNVTLNDMLRDRFALSDLENKNVNIDTELSNGIINDTAILKRLTGRQPVRIQRKNQRAYDTNLHTKLFFSTNKIPYAVDDTDAFYRRNIILTFPNQFEGNKEDITLMSKLTTEEEISGIFNVLMICLRRILSSKTIFVNDKTIAERRARYELAARPIDCFVQDAIAEDSTEYDRTLEETLYQAYEIFAKENKLAITSKENLGKMLKVRLEDGRESSGKRRNFWKGIRLKDKYSQIIDSEQQTLVV